MGHYDEQIDEWDAKVLEERRALEEVLRQKRLARALRNLEDLRTLRKDVSTPRSVINDQFDILEGLLLREIDFYK